MENSPKVELADNFNIIDSNENFSLRIQLVPILANTIQANNFISTPRIFNSKDFTENDFASKSALTLCRNE